MKIDINYKFNPIWDAVINDSPVIDINEIVLFDGIWTGLLTIDSGPNSDRIESKLKSV